MALLRTVEKILGRLVLLYAVGIFLATLYNPLVPVHNDGVVVVTGCSPGGLGFQVVKDIIETKPKAVKVLCTVRKDQDAQALTQAFGTERMRIAKLDVTDTPAVQKLGQELQNEKVIALVNNAGISKHSPLDQLDYRTTYEINVFGVLEFTKALLPALRKSAPGSRIVNIGSMAGTFYVPGKLAYDSSKRALEGVTDSMRVELANEGISVSIVEPGYFRTRMCSDPRYCGDGIEDASEVVLDAVFGLRPRARYPVTTIGLLSASTGAKLAAMVPTRVLDFLILNLQ